MKKLIPNSLFISGTQINAHDWNISRASTNEEELKEISSALHGNVEYAKVTLQPRLREAFAQATLKKSGHLWGARADISILFDDGVIVRQKASDNEDPIDKLIHSLFTEEDWKYVVAYVMLTDK